MNTHQSIELSFYDKYPTAKELAEFLALSEELGCDPEEELSSINSNRISITWEVNNG